MEKPKLVFTSLVRNSSLYFKNPNLNCFGEFEEVEEQNKNKLIINATSKKLEPCKFKNKKIKLKCENNYSSNLNLPIISRPKFSFLNINIDSPLRQGRENSSTLLPTKIDGAIFHSNDSMISNAKTIRNGSNKEIGKILNNLNNLMLTIRRRGEELNLIQKFLENFRKHTNLDKVAIEIQIANIEINENSRIIFEEIYITNIGKCNITEKEYKQKMILKTKQIIIKFEEIVKDICKLERKDERNYLDIMDISNIMYLSESKLLNKMISVGFKEKRIDFQYIYEVLLNYSRKILHKYFIQLKRFFYFEFNQSRYLRNLKINLNSIDKTSILINEAKEKYYNYLLYKNKDTSFQIHSYKEKFDKGKNLI